MVEASPSESQNNAHERLAPVRPMQKSAALPVVQGKDTRRRQVAEADGRTVQCACSLLDMQKEGAKIGGLAYRTDPPAGQSW